MRLKFGSLMSISIDRIDSKGNYARNNVQLVCQWANYGKRNHPNNDMLEVMAELRKLSHS